MNDQLVVILNEILQEFIKTNQPDNVQFSLKLVGFLSVDECALINACTTPTEKFLEMFELLKAKPEESFIPLQKACINWNWCNLLNFIKEKLKGAQREDLLISDAEHPPIFITHYERYIYGFQPKISQFTGRDRHLQEIHDMIQQQSDNFESTSSTSTAKKTANCPIVISGLGGVGKTQLVTEYTNTHRLEFNSIVWLKSQSESSLTTSIYDLASEFDIEAKQYKLKTIINKIFQKLLTFGKKHLIIFDNAYESSIEEIVSDISLKCFVLITSRHRTWPNSKVINLDCFTPEEGQQFVLQSLSELDENYNVRKKCESLQVRNNDNEHTLKLVSELHCFPFALQRATAYIKYRAKMEVYTVEDYLAEYNGCTENAKKLLYDKFQNHCQDSKTNEQTTFATWKAIFDEINAIIYEEQKCQTIETKENESKQKNYKNESLALIILNIMANLAHENLPAELFENIAHRNKDHLRWAFDVLEEFWLVSWTKELYKKYKMVKGHKIVQLITRLHLVKEGRFVDYIITALHLLKDAFPNDDERSPAAKQKRILLPHLTEVKFHLDKVGQEGLIDNKEELYKYQGILLELMFQAHQTLGHAQNCVKVCEELLKIQEMQHSSSKHIETANIYSRLGNAYLYLDDPQNAKYFLEEARMIKEDHYSESSNELAVTLSDLAVAHGELGELQNAKILLERALKIKEGLYGCDHLELASTLSNLGSVYSRLGATKTAINFLKRSLEIQESHCGPNSFHLKETLSNLAVTTIKLGDLETAKGLLEKVLKIEEVHNDPNHFEQAITLSNLASLHCRLGSLQIARDLLEEALPVLEQHYGCNHFQLAETLSSIAVTMDKLGYPDTALEFLNKAFSIKERHFGHDHFELAATLSNLASVYIHLKNYREAEKMLEEALKIQTLHPNYENIQLKAAIFSNTGMVKEKLGDPEAAKKLLEEALSIKETYYGKDHFEVATTLSNLAYIHCRLGDNPTAICLLERALMTEEEYYGPDHPQVAVTRSKLENILSVT